MEGAYVGISISVVDRLLNEISIVCSQCHLFLPPPSPNCQLKQFHTSNQKYRDPWVFKGMKLYQPTFTCINGTTQQSMSFEMPYSYWMYNQSALPSNCSYWMYNQSALPTFTVCNVQKQQQAWTHKNQALVLFKCQ